MENVMGKPIEAGPSDEVALLTRWRHICKGLKLHLRNPDLEDYDDELAKELVNLAVATRQWYDDGPGKPS